VHVTPEATLRDEPVDVVVYDGFGVVAAERDRERIRPQLLRFLGAAP
jgi:hypothetical protein